ncbi:hypothetical protein GTY82_24830 [Streptomyces sp. SID5476]|uniref:Uncharacterized protein n=1 Tax=Streptomyces bottropensis ATCC 25435 TaxID=1054862 RepID=M3FVT2_9ACTN|nr:hypothetical protein SBD_1636 [Streptomyces bottropensis ATCC 25435]MZD20413.1 hypothetical protein [Streptomyces sp. SID5476]
MCEEDVELGLAVTHRACLTARIPMQNSRGSTAAAQPAAIKTVPMCDLPRDHERVSRTARSPR